MRVPLPIVAKIEQKKLTKFEANSWHLHKYNQFILLSKNVYELKTYL